MSSKDTQIQEAIVIESKYFLKGYIKNAEELAHTCNIVTGTSKATVCVTIHKGVMTLIHPIRQRYCTKHKQLSYTRLNNTL